MSSHPRLHIYRRDVETKWYSHSLVFITPRQLELELKIPKNSRFVFPHQEGGVVAIIDNHWLEALL